MRFPIRFGWSYRKHIREIEAVTAKLRASSEALQAVLKTLPNSGAAFPLGKENTTMGATPTPLDAAITALQAQVAPNVSVDASIRMCAARSAGCGAAGDASAPAAGWASEESVSEEVSCVFMTA